MRALQKGLIRPDDKDKRETAEIAQILDPRPIQIAHLQINKRTLQLRRLPLRVDAQKGLPD